MEDLTLDMTEASAVSIRDELTHYAIWMQMVTSTCEPEWIGPTQGTILEIYEIWRIDPFFVGPKTTHDWVAEPGKRRGRRSRFVCH